MADSSLLPDCVKQALVAADQLAQAATALCSATNYLAMTVESGCKGLHEITDIMIAQQKAALLANLAEA